MELISEATQNHVVLTYDNEKIIYFENGKTLEFSDISSGYRSLVLLISDLIYNLSCKCDNFFQSTGVILIDSIEQNLHPTLQAGLVRIIRNHFPNIQFFFTTYSQIMLDAASPDALKIEIKRSNDNFVINTIASN
jgi:predicted ATP-binding protein involved in virulence